MLYAIMILSILLAISIYLLIRAKLLLGFLKWKVDSIISESEIKEYSDMLVKRVVKKIRK